MEILLWEEDYCLALSGGIYEKDAEKKVANSNTMSAHRHVKKGICSYREDKKCCQHPGAGDRVGFTSPPGQSYFPTPPQAAGPRAASTRA